MCFASAPDLITVVVLLPNSLQPAGTLVDRKYCCNVRSEAFHGVNTHKQTNSIYFDLHNALDVLLLNLLPHNHRTYSVNLNWFHSYLNNSPPSV